jgi:haloacetate dehalogenase
LLALWGANGVAGSLYDVLETWREKATHVRGEGFPCGHLIPEEKPERAHDAFVRFFG